MSDLFPDIIAFNYNILFVDMIEYPINDNIMIRKIIK